MANHRQAAKRHRQSLKRRARNKHVLSTVRNAVRAVRSGAAEGADDLAGRMHRAERLLRKAAAKGVLHQRTASRTISRLQKVVSS